MTTDALLLVARETTGAADVLDTHADRLRRRECADSIRTATFESEPGWELGDRFARVEADRVFVVPMVAAHDRDTVDRVPEALAQIPGDVRYGEPVGRSPAVTDVLHERVREHAAPASDVSVLLVAFGSGGTPYHRQAADYHATRLAAETAYGEVSTCYVLQNPVVECARYAAANDRIVAVPLFVSPSAATEQRIPEALELDRGGVAYADVLGTHPTVTDAIAAELAKQRALADGAGPTSVEASPTISRQVTAADGGEPPV